MMDVAISHPILSILVTVWYPVTIRSFKTENILSLDVGSTHVSLQWIFIFFLICFLNCVSSSSTHVKGKHFLHETIHCGSRIR